MYMIFFFTSYFQLIKKIDVFNEKSFHNSYMEIIFTFPEEIRKPHLKCNQI